VAAVTAKTVAVVMAKTVAVVMAKTVAMVMMEKVAADRGPWFISSVSEIRIIWNITVL
jgi:hypothetical protein